MRSRTFITAALLLAAATADAALRFTEPVWRPDLGLAVPSLAGADAEPVELPRAESYLMTAPDGARRLEDRFDTFDLWVAATVRGRWRDADGNRLFLARLSHRPPEDALLARPGDAAPLLTRAAAEARLRPLDPDNAAQRDEAAFSVAPEDLSRPVRPRRAQRRNLLGIFYLPCTNTAVHACLFRPRSPDRRHRPDWYLAILTSADPEAPRRFDEDFLDSLSIPAHTYNKSSSSPDGKALPCQNKETTLLLRDLRRSVANYDDWHFTSSADVAILDNLPPLARGPFVAALTNNLPRYRREYAARVPAAVAATNTLAVVRVFAAREDYLAYVGVEHKWSAALWDTLHRELVLYLPDGDTDRLLRTVWHEAFHQYLAYAAALVTAAPWFNEGHAELFEHSHFDADGRLVFERDPDAARTVQANAAALAEALPGLMRMDYTDYYAGTDDDRILKYGLGWSLAYFLEVGAPRVRFQPFKSLRADYVSSLVTTRSTDAAHRAVLDDETLADFTAAWLAFWKRQ